MDTTESPKGSILIAHVADFHLRDTQYATAQRSADFFEAALRAFRAAAEAGADCICCCGDNFDVARPSAKVIRQMMQLDVELQKLQLPCFTITGNHDASTPTWLDTLFPGRSHTGFIPMDGKRVNFRGFRIAGVPPFKASAYRERVADIERMVADADVVLYHNMVDGVLDIPLFAADPLHVNELVVAPQTAAVLLGDIHMQGYTYRKGLTGRQVLVGYPGSTEMCSKSESTEKSLPLIRVSGEGAVVERTVPLSIRRHISATVKTEEELDALIETLRPVADEHPVVLVEFARSLTNAVSRIHAVLDAQRCVVRCYPLPPDSSPALRMVTQSDEEQLGIEHFVTKRFADRPDLSALALALVTRGDNDANNIVSDFVEERLASIAVRE